MVGKMTFLWSKKFLFKIFLWVGGSIIILMLALQAVMFSYVNRLVDEYQQKNDRLLLTQIENSVVFMNEHIRSICISIFNNAAIISFMRDKNIESDFAEMTLMMNSVTRSVVRANPYVHSIFVYNNYTGVYYSSYRGLLFEDKDLLKITAGEYMPPKFTPIYRQVNEPGFSGSFLTYFYYDASMANGGIAVNIETEWLLNNIRTASSSETEDTAFVMLVTNDGDLFGDANANGHLKDALKEFYQNSIVPSGGFETFFQTELDGVAYHLSYLPIRETELGLLRIVESSQIGKYLNAVRMQLFLITLIFLLAALFITFATSKRLYQPILRLVSRINDQEKYRGDEFRFLEDTFAKNENRLIAYEHEQNTYSATLKATLLLEILNGRKIITGDEFTSQAAKHQIPLTGSQGFIVLLIAVDSRRLFENANTVREREFKLAEIIKIAGENLAPSYPCEGVSLTDNMAAVILNTAPLMNGEILTPLLLKIQTNVTEHLKLSVSISISSYAESLANLPLEFEAAMKNMAYRFAHGPNSIITKELIEAKHQQNDLDYKFTIEKQLPETIKSGEIEKIELKLSLILDEIKTMSYENIMISLFHLSVTFHRILLDTHTTKAMIKHESLNRIGRNLLTAETLSDYREGLINDLRTFFSAEKVEKVNIKHETIIGTAQAIVLESYDDPDLCLTNIADKIKISGKYLSRIFAKKLGVSLPEYINKVRLEKAAELLETTNLSVGKVAQKVGILNESYFYNMFKKRYGASPREYKTLRLLGELSQPLRHQK